MLYFGRLQKCSYAEILDVNYVEILSKTSSTNTLVAIPDSSNTLAAILLYGVVKMEDMVVPDINCTPPADEMDEAPVVEMDEDAVLQMDEDGGVEQAVQKRDSLDDKRKNYYLLDEEEEPTRTIQSGASIGKVMFLTVVVQPKWDSEGNVTFSGKIGILPFVKEVPAQRKSDNRPRGTMETKSMKVNRKVMREFMIDNLLSAIQSAWPENDVGKTIFIQQDNAKPHILPNDPKNLAAVESIVLDIRLIQQPANSLDLNGLDLGFFSSLQSLTDCGAMAIKYLM
ncbi:hypothetical protein D1007_61182 [Hordeum vulgare]|nr:hypothetical protein D1007_61182 [Hordeum vulgare]